MLWNIFWFGVGILSCLAGLLIIGFFMDRAQRQKLTITDVSPEHC